MAYELMIIVSPTSGSDAVSGKLEKVLKDGNATDVKVNNLGKKQLAYPIKKHTEAEYLVYNFEAPGEIAKTISEMLRVEQEMILRYLLTKPKISKVTPRPRRAKKDVTQEPISIIEDIKPKAKVTVRTKTMAESATELKASPSSATHSAGASRVEKATAGKKVAKGVGVTSSTKSGKTEKGKTS